jgi:hypothetical protein
MAPQLAGGLQYSILRGNGSDSFNYVTVAGYLDNEPYSWAPHTDIQSLVDRHPSYKRARELLRARWTTSMMLAFTSRIGGVAPYRFEYSFSVLCFLVAFGPVFLFCRYLIRLSPIQSALTGIAVCSGFWAQLILDTRADSQQSSIPVLLLLAFLIGRIEMENSAGIWRREIILVALAAASLALLYPEILPMATFGFGLFFLVRMLERKASIASLVRIGAAACFALVVVTPVGRLLLTFFAGQMGLAAQLKIHWEQAYYPWLYSSPLSGLWGFGPLGVASLTFRLPWIIAGGILSATLVAAVIRAVSWRKQASTGALLASTLSVAALVQWAYLCSRGQLWAGAKGLSFGYPFLILAVIGYAFTVGGQNSQRLGRFWRMGAKTGVFLMLLVQYGYAVARPVRAFIGVDDPNYIAEHGEYKRHDWNMAPFTDALRSHRGVTVWSNISNPWLADYIGLVLGWDVHLVNVGTSRDLEELHAPRQTLGRQPEYLFLESDSSRPAIFPAGDLLAKNTELALIKLNGKVLTVIGINNPNGLEGDPHTPFFWLGGKPSVVSVLSPGSGCSLLKGRFTIGPSSAARTKEVHLTLASDAGSGRQHVMVRDGWHQFLVRTKSGLNRFTLQVDDPPVRFLPSDRRPLLLRVDDLRFQLEPCDVQ